VHQAGPVRRRQRAEHRLHDRDGQGGRQRTALTQQVPQGPPLHQLHDQEHVPVVAALVIDGDGVEV
jgi:hypothetical protein